MYGSLQLLAPIIMFAVLSRPLDLTDCYFCFPYRLWKFILGTPSVYACEGLSINGFCVCASYTVADLRQFAKHFSSVCVFVLTSLNHGQACFHEFVARFSPPSPSLPPPPLSLSLSLSIPSFLSPLSASFTFRQHCRQSEKH